MTPRAGGEAGKLGDDYELAWTAWHALRVLAGHCRAITLEPHTPLDYGVDLVVELEDVEVHQLKRQRGRHANWTLKALEREGVLLAAARHIAAGRRFVFISRVPATALDRLAEAAVSTDTFDDFVERLSDEDKRDFAALSGTEAWPKGLDAWHALKVVKAQWPDHMVLEDQNAVVAELLLEGASGRTAATALGKLALETMGRRLDAAAIEERLPRFGLRRRTVPLGPMLADAVAGATRRWYDGLSGAMLRPAIYRRETGELVEGLASATPAWLAIGEAGAGKSIVLRQVTERLQADGWTVLALRLDRVGEPATAAQLGEAIDLAQSPVAALAAVAGAQPCAIVLDQLDAASLVSGRHPQVLDAVLEVLRQARAFPAMRVVMACRRFDVEGDERLGALIESDGLARELAINRLTVDEVETAVDALGLPARQLRAEQRELLRLPVNLVLLAAVADEEHPLDFATTSELLTAYWERKRRDCDVRAGRPVRFSAVLHRLASQMSREGTLTTPASVLDRDDLRADADVLATENVITLRNGRASFFHETFFDYVFARGWVEEGEGVVDFLLSGQQELFRRAQLRQILLYLHDRDDVRFCEQFEAVVHHDDVRFHLKDVAVRSLELLREPTTLDVRMTERLRDLPVLGPRVTGAMQTSAWLNRLDRDGVLGEWITDPDEVRRRNAWGLLSSAAQRDPDGIARLLRMRPRRPEFCQLVRHVALVADLDTGRELFELVLEAVRDGCFDGAERQLWQAAEGLGTTRPEWACELLAAWVLERGGAMDLVDGRVRWLNGRDDRLAELAKAAARGAPVRFVDRLLGWYLAVMDATSSGGPPPADDAHFSIRRFGHRDGNKESALIAAAGDAARSLAGEHPERLPALVDALAQQPYSSAAWLLGEALRCAPPDFAPVAARLLLAQPWRLACGYAEHPYWTTYQLLSVISAHLDTDQIHALEDLVLSYRSPTDRRRPGLATFTLLAGIGERRLSARGAERLAVLREQYGPEPLEPLGTRAEFVASPVPHEAAREMDDEGLLRELRRYSGRGRDPDHFGIGGAEQLSNVVQQLSAERPDRFARFGRRLDPKLDPVFLASVLRGIGQSKRDVDPKVIFELMRHAARDRREEVERALSSPVAVVLDAEVPDDIVALIVDRALHAVSPRPGDGPVVLDWGSDDRERPDRLLMEGVNTTRGSFAIGLGNLLVHDPDGKRTAKVTGHFRSLASDPHPGVRVCAAHVLRAGMRFADNEVASAFPTLVEDPAVLSSGTVEGLMAALCFRHLDIVEPELARMEREPEQHVRRAAGRLAAFAGLELQRPDLLDWAVRSSEPELRIGAATVCAHRVPVTDDVVSATDSLRRLRSDPHPEVRKAAAKFAAAVRGHPLRVHEALVHELIASPDFDDVMTDLLLTFKAATERVGDLILAATQRLIENHGAKLADLSQAAAGDARHASELVLRAYAQAAHREERAAALNQVDALLRLRAYGMDRLVDTLER